MTAAVLGWFANWRDPLDWQQRVLDWLRRLGVEDPVKLLIREVTITAAGDGQVVLHCFDEPMRRGPDGALVEITRYVPLTELPPPRPEAVAS